MKINVAMGAGLELVLIASAAATSLTVINDRVIIDNRPSDDPLLIGLNLNLNVTVTDSVGGTAAPLLGTGTFASSNPNYNLSTHMSVAPGPGGV